MIDDKGYLIKANLYDGLDCDDDIIFYQNDTRQSKIVAEFTGKKRAAIDVADCTVVCVIQKSDKEIVTAYMENDFNVANRAEYVLSQNALASTGKGIITIFVYGSDNERQTFGSIKFKVLKDVNSGSVESTTEYPVLTKLISDTKVVVNDAENAKNEILGVSADIANSEKQRVSAETKREENESSRINEFASIKKEYESLKGIMIDENNAVNLQNQINEANSQLEHIAYNTIHLKEFYNDDFSLALKNALTTPNVSKIIIDGTYDVKTGQTLSNINNVSIIGNCNLNFVNNIASFLTFKSCNNVIIDGLNINCNNYENYKTISITEGSNNAIRNVSISNIKNLDSNLATYNIYIYSDKTTISNIKFKNILQRLLSENITSGKGSVQNIYFSIDETHREGIVSNIYSQDCHNIDLLDNVLFGDYDTIKTQYRTGIDNFINSKLIIENVIGHNFGKRLVKLQTGGVSVKTLKGYTNKEDTYSAIAIHNKNVIVDDVYFESINNASSSIIELGYYSSNITVKNVIGYGDYRGRVLVLNSSTVDNSNPIGDNIKFDNLTLNCNARTFMMFYVAYNNVKLTNSKINGSFSDGFITQNSNICNYIENLNIDNCDIEMTSKNIVDFSKYQIEKVKISIINSKINYSYLGEANDNIRSININPITTGEFIIKDSELNINNQNYLYGHYKLYNIDNFICENTKMFGLNTNVGFDVQTKKAMIKNVFIENGNITIKISETLNVNGITGNTLSVDKLGEGNNPIVSLTGLNCVFSQNGSGNILDIISSDVKKATQLVTLTNGNGMMSVTFPTRQKSLKIINHYSTTKGKKVSFYPKDLGSYTEFTLEVVESSGYSGDVECTVLYTL